MKYVTPCKIDCFIKYVLLKFAGVNVLEQYWLVLYWLVRTNSIVYSPITITVTHYWWCQYQHWVPAPAKQARLMVGCAPS